MSMRCRIHTSPVPGVLDRHLCGAGLERISPGDRLARTLADAAIPAKHVASRLEAERGAPRRAPERVREDAAAVAQHESGIVTERRRQVTRLHPPFRFPPHGFDLFGVEVG